MATLDDLYDLRNYFYLGFYNSVISEGLNLHLDNPHLQFERDILLARSFIATGQFDKLMTEMASRLNNTIEFECLKILAAFVKSKGDKNIDQSMVAHSCLEAVQPMINQSNSIFQKLLIASIYLQEGLLEPAFKLLVDNEHPECLAQIVQIYLRINRLDLAEKALNNLKMKTNDSAFSQLVEAFYFIVIGEDGYQNAYYNFQELIEGNGANSLLLNGQAVCCMHLEKWTEAENLLLDGLKKDPKNSELLTNLSVVSNMLGKNEVSDKCIDQLTHLKPHCSFIKDLETKAFMIRQISQKYQI